MAKVVAQAPVRMVCARVSEAASTSRGSRRYRAVNGRCMAIDHSVMAR